MTSPLHLSLNLFQLSSLSSLILQTLSSLCARQRGAFEGWPCGSVGPWVMRTTVPRVCNARDAESITRVINNFFRRELREEYRALLEVCFPGASSRRKNQSAQSLGYDSYEERARDAEDDGEHDISDQSGVLSTLLKQ